MRLSTVVMSACALAAGLPAAAQAQSLTEPTQAPELQLERAKAAGVERARAAGIKVDPAAAKAMAEAPIGSCFNDPTQAKCPPAHTVTGYADAAGSSFGPAPGTTTAARAKRPSGRARARAAQFNYQCEVHAAIVYYAAGMAHGDGWNRCSAAVTRQELYVNIDKFYKDVWYQYASDYATAIGGPRIDVHVHYTCTAYPLRAWRTQAYGYSLLQGVWYAGYDAVYRNLYCG